MDPYAEVLGVSYFGPVAGSPLIPPEVITFYFIIFLVLLTLIYIFLHKKKQPATLFHKIKLFVLAALIIKVVLIGGGALLAAYWLVPSPNILTTSPTHAEQNYPTTQKIEIIFDRPIDRTELVKNISPEVPGFWMFENSIYTTHLYRKLVFVPTQNLKPDTEYKISLSNIKNMLNFSDPYEYSYSFKTQPTPKVESVSPVSGTADVDIFQPITINLTQPNSQISQFDFELSPSHPLETKLDSTKKTYTLSPKEPFKQGTSYQLAIKKTDLVYNIPTNTVIEQGSTETVYVGAFTSKEAPGIDQFTPAGESILLTTPISITFSSEMDRASVQQNLVFEPQISGNFRWTDDKTLNFKPSKLQYDTQYKVTIKKGAKAKTSGFLEEDVSKSFTTIGRVKVSSFSPTNGWSAASVESPIKVNFNQEVDKASTESKFSISPNTPGTFSWDKNSLIFTPSSKLPFSTQFTVIIASGVKTINGLDSTEPFSATFTTQEQTVKLSVPAYLQRHALSCELAALRMALAYREVDVSEETLLQQVGVDSTPHQGNIWGNPYSAFVGNVDGRQMADGYGVYWGPIARVAKGYRGAQEFEGWSISQLTEAISQGHPVVIWVYSSGGWPTSWNTPDGQNIYAVRDEHAVTAVGFVGLTSNPSQIIINDPLVGQVYWGRALFDKKWNIFNRSGVVVY